MKKDKKTFDNEYHRKMYANRKAQREELKTRKELDEKMEREMKEMTL